MAPTLAQQVCTVLGSGWPGGRLWVLSLRFQPVSPTLQEYVGTCCAAIRGAMTMLPLPWGCPSQAWAVLFPTCLSEHTGRNGSWI